MNLAEQMMRLTLQERDHAEQTSLAIEDRDPAEELTEKIFKLAIEEDTLNDRSPCGPSESRLTGHPEAFAGVGPRTALLFEKIAGSQYSRLRRLDEQLDARSKEVLFRLDSLASPDCTVNQGVIHFLEEEVVWLEMMMAELDTFVAADESVVVFKNALRDRFEAIKDAVDCYKLILSNRLPDGLSSEPITYDTGKSKSSVI